LPETAATVPILKGVEFVALSGDLYGMPHRDARRRAHEVLNYVGLGELRYRRLEEYSTGNLQRLKLAAALVHDPQLLLLDEPTNGLDPAGRHGMLRLIEDLIAETDKSVILCTHLLGDVERLCQQVVVLHKGTVVRAGPMAELKTNGTNIYELGWLGADEPFLNGLHLAGVEVSRLPAQGKAIVAAPASWNTQRFFEIAITHGVVLTHMKPEEEDLERMFFRVTKEASGAA
jgi:ABC-2 type transport system ATP-binding protein